MGSKLTSYDRWIRVDDEVKSTIRADGFVKVYIDGALVVHEVRQTLPDAASANHPALGIYHASKSEAREPYETQIVYFDGMRKLLQEPFALRGNLRRAMPRFSIS